MAGTRTYPRELDRPIRDVQAFLSGRGGLRPFAVASADFEPLPPGGDRELPFAFVNEVPAADLPPEFGAAFGEGVLARLRGWSRGGALPWALRVRLRHAHWRAGESTAAGFAAAGEQAVHEFDESVAEGTGPRRLVTLPLTGRRAEPAGPGRDVHVRLVKPWMCGHYAVATAEFTPLPADADELFEFVLDVPDERLPRPYAEAFERGLREELYAAGDGRLPVRPFRVRLHDAQWHEVDSNELIFGVAGRRAAAEALGPALAPGYGG
ncbi:hypothetical protein [Streptomyces rubellomurinus]|uniref:hypothetical protein n=1 Tax=Streptomyces rubellomurinus (strain ATCC 31215) TaxID=359131 RepID=UPI000698DA7E|nr:hypothetical protein [Streptomyces rubellomurinus]